jgi:GntR family transcriptional regulator/MocR family aminotransferase
VRGFDEHGLMWKAMLAGESRDGVSLQARLRHAFVEAILDGRLAPGRRVPSSRDLAALAGVSRTTASIVMEQLVADGYLDAKPRNGYFVSAAIDRSQLVSAGPFATRTAAVGAQSAPDWSARLAHVDTRFPWVERPPGWQACRYRFVYGEIDPRIFPFADWREATRLALDIASVRDWGQDTAGHDSPALVDEVIKRILPRRGIAAKPDEIMLTLGTQHGLYLLALLLMRNGTRVGMEEPGYTDARYIFARHAATIVPLPLDARGLETGPQLADCEYVYCTPSHQCPTGVTMSTERRVALLAHANAHDQIVIEDDYEPELQYAGAATPALKAIDKCERVIYLSSLSKVVCPGLRIGFIVGPARLVTELKALRRLMIRQIPGNNQASTVQFVRQGHYDRLLTVARDALKARAEILVATLAARLPEAEFDIPTGGAAVWLRLPGRPDLERLRAACFEAGVLLDPVEPFFASPPRESYVRLNFSTIALEQMEAGIGAFAAVARRILRQQRAG